MNNYLLAHVCIRFDQKQESRIDSTDPIVDVLTLRESLLEVREVKLDCLLVHWVNPKENERFREEYVGVPGQFGGDLRRGVFVLDIFKNRDNAILVLDLSEAKLHPLELDLNLH